MNHKILIGTKGRGALIIHYMYLYVISIYPISLDSISSPQQPRQAPSITAHVESMLRVDPTHVTWY